MMTIKRLRVLSSLLVLLSWSAGPFAQTIHPKGTTIWDPVQARNGLTFIAAPDGTARLVGMLGELVNTWTAPNDSLMVKMPILSSPGHILAFHAGISVPGYGRFRGSVVSEYDYGGREVWRYAPGPKIDIFPFGGFHHDLTRLDNGNTILMASVLVSGSVISGKTLIDDCILEVNPAGTIVWAWYTFVHFDEFEFTQTAKEQIWNLGGDWAHANSVTVIPQNEYSDSRFTPGNLLISYRNLNTIIIVDKVTGHIVWKAGPNGNVTIGQHYAYMIPPGLDGAGRILAFDNGGSGGYPPTFREYSRVVEIDPLSKTMPWIYTASRSGLQNWSFFSPFISGAQRMSGRNTLIVEGTKGRIFEINSNGGIVWEYMSPYSELRPESDGHAVLDQNTFRAFRLPFYWPLFPAPADGGV